MEPEHTDSTDLTPAQLEARLAAERSDLARLADEPFGQTAGDPDGEPAPPLEDDEFEQADPITVAHGRYLAEVIEAMGPEAAIVPCGSCNGYGFKPFELPADPHTETCPDCQGWGEVLTGSSVAGQIKRACPTCKSKGWREIGAVVPITPQTTDRAPAPPGFYYDPAGNLIALTYSQT